MKNSVRERRQQEGWSQAHLADLVGVTRLTVISIEKGRFDPSLPLAFRLASLFAVPIEELFEPEGCDAPPAPQ
ncbi:helix-turn-helix transcriptional regulator [Demequina aestuarii]|uniref:helix-turn-helix transcriptional regulator n=1 Tax=Demequina aestuarii TaxID=327095 RepID=UPI0007841DF2|nr:helix-turn-helix transcriptional regulator [Demequina aestuarii]